MPRFDAHGLSFYYEQHGSRAAPPLVLIHGWTCQLVHWPKVFVEGLAERGFRVITIDNRDIGLSDKVAAASTFTLATLLAKPAAAPSAYNLKDMAGDIVALLNHLGQAGAHMVGFSMGGMITQRLAIHHPERVFSLTSISSGTGNPALPRATEAAAQAFFRDPPRSPRAATIRFVRDGWDVIGGPHYKSTAVGLGQFAEAAYDRDFSPDGHARQAAAILKDGNRAPELRNVKLPALVIHGAEDPLAPLAGGEDTANAIPGARLVTIPKMGHDLPEPLLPELIDLVARHAAATAQR